MLLALVLLFGSAGAGAAFAAEELLPELQTIYDNGLSSLTSSTGYWDKPFRQSSNSYTLTLPEEESTFQLSAVPTETSASYGPTLTIDGRETAYGLPSQEISLEIGEKRVIPVVVTPRSGKPATYRVTAYRTASRITGVGTISQVRGSTQLALQLKLPAGKKINAMGIALRFDPSQLRLAAQDTNEVIATASLGKGISFAKGFRGSSGVMEDTVATLSNSGGTLVLQYNQKEAGAAYTVPADDAVLTLYFRVEEHAVLSDSGLGALANNASVVNGAFLTEQAGDGTFFQVSYPGFLQLSGLDRSLTTPVSQKVEGGSIQISPQKEAYAYGEVVTLSAVPEEGYVFSAWSMEENQLSVLQESGCLLEQGSAAEERLLDASGVLEQNELTLRMHTNLDVSTLRPVFTHLDETLPSGAGLDFTAPFYGDSVLAFNPAYGEETAIAGETMVLADETRANTDQDMTSVSQNMARASETGASAGSDMAMVGETTAQTGELIAKEIAVQEKGNAAVSIMETGEESKDGLTRIEWTEEALSGEESLKLYSDETVQEGTHRTFQVRDIRYDQVSAKGWSEENFTLKAIRQSDGSSLFLWLCDNPQWQPMNLTEGQLAELADSFAESYTHLAQHYHDVTDTNGNGGLDILLYDIRDPYTSGNSTYTGGFVNTNEFYGLLGSDTAYGVGNSGDVLHLDTYPQMGQNPDHPELSQIKSTMAHETQHLSFASGFETSAQFSSKAASAWINEGLSLTVEDELFGVLESRISKYNHSDLIREGLSLTEWGNTTDSYALAYLFFQYLSAQAAEPGFVSRFYGKDYGGTVKNGETASQKAVRQEKEQKALLQVLGDVAAFRGQTLPQIMESFYLALLLKEDSGPYGFLGDEDFDQVRPQVTASAPTGKLAPGGAVYWKSSGSFQPQEVGAIRYVGVSEPVYSLSIGTSEGGSARAVGNQYAYIRGASAEIKATADYGYRFLRWSGAASGTANPAFVLMDGNKTVTPVFEPLERYALTAEYDNTQGSILAVNERGETITDLSRVVSGSVLRLTAEAGADYAFDHWEGDVSGDSKTVQLVMDGDKQVRAVFRNAKPVPLSSVLKGTNGEGAVLDQTTNTAQLVTADGTVTVTPVNAVFQEGAVLIEGTWVTLTAVPAAGKAFSHWKTEQNNVLRHLSEESRAAYEEDGGLLRMELTLQIDSSLALTPVFRDADELEGESLYLSYLALLRDGFAENQTRGLIQQTAEREIGFVSQVMDYDLYLLNSDPANLVFHAVKKSIEGSQRAEMSLWREGIRVGEPLVIADESNDDTVDENGNKTYAELTKYEVKDTRDGDEIRITVSNGEPDTKERVTYRIQVHRNAPGGDPQVKGIFEALKTNVDGVESKDPTKVTLSIFLKNIRTEAAKVTIEVEKGAIVPLDQDGKAIVLTPRGVTDISESCAKTEQERYLLTKAEIDTSDLGKDRILLTFETNGWITGGTEFPEEETEETMAVSLLFEKKEESARIDPVSSAVVLAYDSQLLEMELLAEMTELGEDIVVEGSFFAYNPSQTEGFQPSVSLQGSGKEVVGTVTMAAIAPGDYAYGLREYVFQAVVPAGQTCTVTIRKAAHTDLVIGGLKIDTAYVSDGALNVNEVIRAALAGNGITSDQAGTSPLADLAGIGIALGQVKTGIMATQASTGTSPALAGADATVKLASQGILKLCAGDITGEGRITLEDKNILMSPYLYGRAVNSAAASNAAASNRSMAVAEQQLQSMAFIVQQSQDLTEKELALRCDIDGDGMISLADLNILMSPYNYGKGRQVIQIPADTRKGD